MFIQIAFCESCNFGGFNSIGTVTELKLYIMDDLYLADRNGSMCKMYF